MPTYEYRCKACDQDLEVVQSFTDDTLTTCEACGGPLRKLFGNVGISFKGTGFYKNDSRDKPKSATKDGDKSSSDKSSSDKAGADKSSASDAASGRGKDAGPSTTSTTKPDTKSATPAKKSPAASTSKSS